MTETGNLKRTAITFHYPNYAFHKRNRLGSAIREENFKLLRWFDDDSVELYDLAADPGETTDLAGQNPEKAAALRKKLERDLEATGARMPVPAAE